MQQDQVILLLLQQGNKGTALLFASGNPDTTNPKIIEIQTGGDVVDDTSPQLGGNLDTNDFNIAFDDAHGIIDENGNEQLIFQTTGSAVNQFDMTNAATGNAPSNICYRWRYKYRCCNYSKRIR